MKTPLRLVFMGTPDFAVPTLKALAEAGKQTGDWQIVAVYSQPPRPAGRGMGEKKSPVHLSAEKLDIPVFTPQSLKDGAAQTELAKLNADAAIVIAYGQILPVSVLELFPKACWNGHASLLPRWRGAAPIQRAIMAGDKKTGVSIMRMEEGLDTGPVAMRDEIAIDDDMNAGALHDALAELTAALMLRLASRLCEGEVATTPQSEDGIIYAEKISKDEARIDWSWDGTKIHNYIRGLSPFPSAWCVFEINGKKERVKLLGSSIATNANENSTANPGQIIGDDLVIACGKGAVRLIRLQRPGKKPQAAEEFMHGARLKPGAMLE